jgi:hypothetical protein
MLIQAYLPQYVYEPIDPSSRTIRLLTLLPSTQKFAHLSGQLHFAPLEPTAPGYEALSYVWDDYEWARSRSPDTFSLQVGDRDITITRSLALAPFHIRHLYRPRVLWVDAVCIDQSNNNEKNHQVQQIYTIYSLARRVLIWLGDDDLDDSSTSVGRLLTSEHGNLKMAAVLFRSWWSRVW